jgi:hypothetical protein
MITLRFAPLAAALALSGCYLDFDHGGSGYYGDSSDPYYDPGTSSVPITATIHSGDMGGVHDFSGNITSATADSYGGWANVHVTSASRSGGWAAMSILDIQGGLEHPDLRPGAHFEFTSAGYGYSDGTELFISAVGCSGPTEGTWEFDQGADNVVVDVFDAGGGTVEVRYAAQFNSYDYDTGASTPQTVTGAFRYRR